MNKVKITFRGWQGHLCLPAQFHINTLIEGKGKQIIVSTVGECRRPGELNELAELSGKQNSFYETMVFEAIESPHNINGNTHIFLDCDVNKALEVYTDHYSDEVLAAEGHDRTVLSVVRRLG